MDGDDPLRQEWFLAIISHEFCVILCGLDNLAPAKSEAYRKFDTVWSFNRDIVNRVLDVLEDVIRAYKPSVLPNLRASRQKFPVIDPNPEILTLFTVELLRFEDVLHHELIRTTHDLEISAQLYRTLASNAPVILMMLSADGHVLLLTGTKVNQLFNQGVPKIGESIWIVTENQPQLKTAMQEALDHTTTSTTVLANQQTYELRTHTLYSNDEVESIVCIFIDMTERAEYERNRLEKALIQIELQKERELSEMRKQLMITMSHELRNPLAAIRSASDLLTTYNDKLTPEKRKDRLITIQEQIQYLSEILKDIDTVVHHEHGEIIFTYVPVATEAFIGKIIHNLNINYSHQVQFSCTTDAEMIYNDDRWLAYIISNLLTNAAKYSDASQPIHLRFSRQDDNIIIEVEDQGIGIPPDEIQYLFHPFYRARNAKKISGTGLGLVIVKNIAEAQGGSISVKSKLNVGTTVTVKLPVNPKASVIN